MSFIKNQLGLGCRVRAGDTASSASRGKSPDAREIDSAFEPGKPPFALPNSQVKLEREDRARNGDPNYGYTEERAAISAAFRGMRVKFDNTESQLANLAEKLPQLVWFTRPDGYHDYFNRLWYEFTGLSAEQCVGHRWQAAIHPDDLSRVGKSWRRALETRASYEAEFRLREASGHYRWVLSRGRPDRNEANEVVRWFGTCTIIDAQKRAEQSLRILEAQYRLALDAARLGTWKISLDKETISWDEGSCALFDLPAEGLMSMPLEAALEHIHPDDREEVRARIAAAIAPGSNGAYEVECRTILEDGSHRWTRSNGRVFYNQDGGDDQVAGLSGVISDITDKRSAAEAQELLTRELTHRVKNLFAIANGMVSMTARTARDTKEMATALRGRLSALSRAHELVQPVTANVSGTRVGLDELALAVLAPYTQDTGSKSTPAVPR